MPSREELRTAALGVLTPGFVGTELPAWLSGLLGEGLAGVWLFGHNITDAAQCRELTGRVHDAAPHALVCADEEGGTVTRLNHQEGSPWPGAWALGVVDDVGTTRSVAAGLGSRLTAAGIDLGAAPVADVNTEPQNPVIGVRSFGADPQLAARHVAATVAGLREAGVLSCAKHFPGHGSTRQDSHLTLPTLEVPADLLRSRELVPFRAAVEAGVDVVMTGHLVVPEHGPLPATLNPALVRMLREDLGFTGVVCTDAIDMEAVAGTVGRARAAVLALVAGVDLVCVGNPVFPGDYDARQDVLDLVDALVRSVEVGELAAERLTEAAARVRALGLRQAGRRGAPTRGAPPADGVSGAGETVGLDAARRAVRSSGAPARLTAPLVVGASAAGNIASGARQEVMLQVLAERLGGRTVPDLSSLAGAAPHEGGAPVVLVTDDHSDLSDPLVRDAVAQAAAVVHAGIRDLPADLPARWVVRTFGGGRASATAAAETLASAGQDTRSRH
ncbi:glycoside hydrolase family 3 N-terminal domain-containing protein [Ornithinimicrobium pekingense]|uniref:Sugar hydrolase n=1 Tax=Ornithinimicrobium pekingense TaxID=384677 RepID=A0ABQ2F5B4_9MICO|nr:glycoside hydrolase family 3 N-terminal domain-containing protein [Ornithinimicrobium pekingense]GGK60491.1 sugar hydrolase [Ornithinimicrobium pekingense]